jgi:uncharacterized protein YjbJ (UPF0337 family)
MLRGGKPKFQPRNQSKNKARQKYRSRGGTFPANGYDAWQDVQIFVRNTMEPCFMTFVLGAAGFGGHLNGDRFMSSTTDKIAGLAKEAAGTVKQTVGKAVGSEKLQAEGIAQEAKGHVQKTAGDAKEAVKTAVNKVADAVDKKI